MHTDSAGANAAADAAGQSSAAAPDTRAAAARQQSSTFIRANGSAAAPDTRAAAPVLRIARDDSTTGTDRSADAPANTISESHQGKPSVEPCLGPGSVERDCKVHGCKVHGGE